MRCYEEVCKNVFREIFSQQVRLDRYKTNFSKRICIKHLGEVKRGSKSTILIMMSLPILNISNTVI